MTTQRRMISPPVKWFALGALAFLVALILAAAFFGPNPSPAKIRITQAQMGAKWPFTFTQGDLECVQPSAVIITDPDSKIVYSLNGAADTIAANRGWLDMRPVWRDNPDAPLGGPKIWIGDLIGRGLGLCR